LGLLKDSFEYCRRNFLWVGDDDGDNLGGVLIQEGFDFGQVAFNSSAVEEQTGGMAKVQLIVLHVRLDLQHPDAQFQLLLKGDLLVPGQRP